MTLSASARTFLSAWKFMWATPKRRLLVLTPVGINVGLWVMLIPLVFRFVRMATAVVLPDATWATVLGLLAGFFIVVAVVILAVFLFVAVTTIIGAPFYGALAEEAMREAGMVVKDVSWVKEIYRASRYTLKLGGLFIVLQFLLTFLHVIPVLGSFLYLAGSFAVTILLLAMEFFGEAFGKDNVSFRARLVFLARHHRSIIAFAVPVFFLLLVPGLNLFIPPLAVVSASRMYASRL